MIVDYTLTVIDVVFQSLLSPPPLNPSAVPLYGGNIVIDYEVHIHMMLHFIRLTDTLNRESPIEVAEPYCWKPCTYVSYSLILPKYMIIYRYSYSYPYDRCNMGYSLTLIRVPPVSEL